MLDSTGFDAWAGRYDGDVSETDARNAYPFAGRGKLLRRISDVILACPGCSVLDLGFGTGELAAHLLENGCRVSGQDFSGEMIRIASERAPGARFFCGDFADGIAPELAAERYDYIVATYSLHHLKDEEKIRLLRQLLPLLHPGGSILIGDVAFSDRAEHDAMRSLVAEEWDDEEFYFVFAELLPHFPGAVFEKMSACAGLIRISY